MSGIELIGMLIGSLIMGGAILISVSEPKKK
jgi:hypothetical protein